MRLSTHAILTGRKRCNKDAGQVVIVVVLMLSLFLLAVLAFAVDYTNIWFQRQQAQTAADAACQAGAMDMYQLITGASFPAINFVPGTPGRTVSTATPVGRPAYRGAFPGRCPE
jgi:Putative Flp pilus-assembly TadE/G-like